MSKKFENYNYKQDKINAGNSLADEYQAGTGLPFKIALWQNFKDEFFGKKNVICTNF